MGGLNSYLWKTVPSSRLYLLRRYEGLTYKSIPLLRILENFHNAPSLLLHTLQLGMQK